jgi:hypothetical protein
VFQIAEALELKSRSICKTLGRDQEFVRSFSGKTRRKKPRVRLMRRWECNIEMDLKKWDVGGCGMNLFGIREEPMALTSSAVMNLLLVLKAWDFLIN